MAICGYNKKIGAGLNLLFEGMIDSIEEKTIKLGTINALNDEIEELEIMIAMLENNGVIQDMFVGLNQMAKALFVEARHILLESEQRNIRDVLEEISPIFVNTIKGAENYRDHLVHADNLVSIRKVAEWSKNIQYPTVLPNMDIVDRVSEDELKRFEKNDIET